MLFAAPVAVADLDIARVSISPPDTTPASLYQDGPFAIGITWNDDIDDTYELIVAAGTGGIPLGITSAISPDIGITSVNASSSPAGTVTFIFDTDIPDGALPVDSFRFGTGTYTYATAVAKAAPCTFIFTVAGVVGGVTHWRLYNVPTFIAHTTSGGTTMILQRPGDPPPPPSDDGGVVA